MFEKVNPSHPDKLADRIAGAIVDLAYKKNENPKVAVEVLLGHGACHTIIETSEEFVLEEIKTIVNRIAGQLEVDLKVVPQDPHLSLNQNIEIRCGDNGIFKGVPITAEEQLASNMAHFIYEKYPFDGKYIIDDKNVYICQSNADREILEKEIYDYLLSADYKLKVNPLGYWTGGSGVDSGATNRKLGSDMAGSVTGGGLHGKDLSKADVSINIYAFLKAQETGEIQEYSCAIGDTIVDGKTYSSIVEIARNYIARIGGFEKLAEWGLV